MPGIDVCGESSLEVESREVLTRGPRQGVSQADSCLWLP